MKRATTSFSAISRQECRGFSLLEMVLTLIILGIIASVGAQMMGSGFSAYFTGRDIADADWQARLAFERMSRELRMVRAPADLVIAAPAEITFVDTGTNTVRFYLNGATLMRSEGGAVNAQPLADGVSALAFSYLRNDALTAEAAIPANVYFITVAMTVTRGNTNSSFRTTVRPRNFP